jgi:hypothetical protein
VECENTKTKKNFSLSFSNKVFGTFHIMMEAKEGLILANCSSLPGTAMQMPEMICQWTASLMFNPSTKATPNVTISCINEARDPLIDGSAISTI